MWVYIYIYIYIYIRALAVRYWTLHFQYSNNITVRHVTVFNPNNGSIEAPNGDGMDVDSSTNVHVHDCLFDVADDSLCIKSGADFLGRQVNRPTANVLFENTEVRNGPPMSHYLC